MNNEETIFTRNYFAGMALQGMIASCDDTFDHRVGEFKSIAKQAFGYADAMIIEMNKIKGTK